MVTTILNTAPVTRLKVNPVHSSGLAFQGFEQHLIGKIPQDAVYVTQRISDACPTSHAMAACLAAEKAAEMAPSDNARAIRNLVLGAEFIQSHLYHFYHLALPGYIQLQATAPWTPGWEADRRFSHNANQRLLEHSAQSLAIRRQTHEMAAIFGGKLPYTAAFEVGGVLVGVDQNMLARFLARLDPILDFIDHIYLPDVELLGQAYPEYYELGRGYGNLLAFGVFDQDATDAAKLFRRGRVVNGSAMVQDVDLAGIVETSPTPRYDSAAYETGALARLWINGDYRRGISVMDRYQARAREASQIAHAMRAWVNQINPAAIAYKLYNVPAIAASAGLTETPRGALGHWLTVSNRKIASYRVLTPTDWNCSPTDETGVAGPLEKALQGLPVSDASQPIEALRVAQSFDPSLSCVVH
jgi:hydrogenase large subunit